MPLGHSYRSPSPGRSARGSWSSGLGLTLALTALSVIAALFALDRRALRAEDGLERCSVRIPISGPSGGPRGAPDGWEVKEWRGKADIRVADTEIGGTIHLVSESTSTAVYRDISFSAEEYPVLRWRWMVKKLPEGGSVLKRSTDDQAAQVYVVFPRWPAIVNSRVIGYIWDTETPEGTVTTSTKTPNTRYIVLRSGKRGLGEWFEERRNVLEDYRMLFREDPPKAGRISVMTDSDDTGTSAESFFGDICLSREAGPS